jgi:alkanesulfonate monooxygenase SsuD/methylene tetrahydromethanopterin reductase-like flavin-dependent oxidoreductase (luciferase family)
MGVVAMSDEDDPHTRVEPPGPRIRFSSFHLVHGFPGWSATEVYDYHLELVEWLEDLRFDGVWFAEHHFRDYGIVPSVMGMLSHVAARTERLRLGTGVMVLPLHNPLEVAEQAAQLDVLSKGRLDFGVGRGYQSVEFDGYRVALEEARERFLEALDVIVGLWTNPSFRHSGRFYETGDVELVPRPVQRPHPPLRVAAVSPETVTLCAARGLPILVDAATPFSRIRDAARTWREAATAAGRDADGALVAQRLVHVAPSIETAREDLERFAGMFDRSRVFNDRSAPIDSSTGRIAKGFEAWDRYGKNVTVDTDFQWERQEVIGDPARVIGQIEMLRSFGYSEVMCDFGSTLPIPLDEMKKTLKLFADEVIPAFR